MFTQLTQLWRIHSKEFEGLVGSLRMVEMAIPENVKNYISWFLVFSLCVLAGCGRNKGMMSDGYEDETLMVYEDCWALEGLDLPYTVRYPKDRCGEPDAILTHEHGSGMGCSNAGISSVIYSESDDGKIWDMVFKLRPEDGIVLGECTALRTAPFPVCAFLAEKGW